MPTYTLDLCLLRPRQNPCGCCQARTNRYLVLLIIFMTIIFHSLLLRWWLPLSQHLESFWCSWRESNPQNTGFESVMYANSITRTYGGKSVTWTHKPRREQIYSLLALPICISSHNWFPWEGSNLHTVTSTDYDRVKVYCLYHSTTWEYNGDANGDRTHNLRRERATSWPFRLWHHIGVPSGNRTLGT